MKLARKLLEKDIKHFEATFRQSLKSKNFLLNQIIKYFVSNKGKQLRATLVMLSAKLCGKITDLTHRSACLVEYLHSATVIHDDVIDEAYVRRKHFSVKALWGNKLAVIFGDYMLSKGLLLSLEHEDYNSLQILSTAVKRMAEAEYLQYEKNTYNKVTEEVYYDIIQGKTASLFSAACSLGAWTSSQDEKKQGQFYQIGQNLGMAFQMKDDLFDYSKLAHTGKSSMQDLKEKKATLPYIYAKKNLKDSDRRRLKSIMRKANSSSSELEEAVQLIVHSGGVDYASQVMIGYAQESIKQLKQFPESVERLAFEDLIQYVIHRSV